MKSPIGKLVVLTARWNLSSDRVGIIIDKSLSQENVFLVMWTDKNGVKLRYHLIEALLPVNDKTLEKIEERVCDIK